MNVTHAMAEKARAIVASSDQIAELVGGRTYKVVGVIAWTTGPLYDAGVAVDIRMATPIEGRGVHVTFVDSGDNLPHPYYQTSLTTVDLTGIESITALVDLHRSVVVGTWLGSSRNSTFKITKVERDFPYPVKATTD